MSVNVLRDGLTKRGHDVFIFAPAFSGYADDYANVYRLPSVRTVFMRDYPLPIPHDRETERAFASLHLDVVHTQTPFLLGLLGMRWSHKYGVPVVSTNHTVYTEYVHYFPVRPKALTREFLIWLMRQYYSRCEAVVVPSRPIESMLRTYGIEKPIRVIKTGIIAAEPYSVQKRAEIRQKHGVGEDDFFLLYVGRIAREKNLRMLLNAFKKVLAVCGNARLALVGGGPAIAETKAMAADIGVLDRVEFVGMLHRSEIDPLYAAADAFVFPSTTETQGIAICEALSAGLPAVAVDAGGIPENIQPGVDGFLTHDDADEFAERICYLIDHPDARKEMGKSARANAADFSIDRMIREFEDFYASVISGKPLHA